MKDPHQKTGVSSKVLARNACATTGALGGQFGVLSVSSAFERPMGSESASEGWGVSPGIGLKYMQSGGFQFHYILSFKKTDCVCSVNSGPVTQVTQ